MKKPPPPQPKQIAWFILFWSLLFGAFVRFLPALGASFPLSDGGLFYTMARDLLQAHFSLPLYTTYNQAAIPFAYPPLGIYILAFLSQFFDELQLVRWLPSIYGALSLLAFYLLAKAILEDDLKASLATFAFAMVPSASGILIWGGGVTRGLGFLFCLLALYHLFCLFYTSRRAYLLPAALFSALVVLSHPSAAFMTALFALFFWLSWGRTLSGARSALLVAALVALLTAPWWLLVLLRHGLQPLLSGFSSGWYTLFFFVPYLRLSTTSEVFMTFVMVLAVLSGLVSLSRKQYFLPLWFLLSLVSQRDGAVYASIPVSLLFGVAIVDLVLPVVSGQAPAQDHTQAEGLASPLASGGARLLVSFLLIYNLLNAMSAAQKIASLRVTAPEQQAAAWITANSPAGSKFLLLTYGDPLNLPFLEWFPALTGRVSLTTVQGYEWLPGSTFLARKTGFTTLQPCLTADLACVERWVSARGLSYDYLIVHHGYVGDAALDPARPQFNAWISSELRRSPRYQPVYTSPILEIYQRISPFA